MSYLRNVDVAITDGANLDAFSRLRVSSPDTVFDSTFQYDLQPLIYYTSTANSGVVAHDAELVSAKRTTAAVASSSAIIQSKAYHRYIPGKSQLIILTGLMDSATANILKRAGYFDAENGIFLEQNGTTDLAIVRRTSVGVGTTDNRVLQASLGISEVSDAIAIVVSEETGAISISHSGRMLRRLDPERLENILTAFFRPGGADKKAGFLGRLFSGRIRRKEEK